MRRATIAIMVLADAIALVLAVLGAYAARQLLLVPTGDLSEHVVDAAVIIAVGWLLAIIVFNGYDSRLVPAGTELFSNVLHASLAAAGIVGGVVYLLDIELSRAFFLALFVIGPPLLLLDRLIIRRVLNMLRTRGHLRSAVLAVGSLGHIDGIARTIDRERWLGYDIIGAVIPRATASGAVASRADGAVGSERADASEASEVSSRGIPVLGAEADLLQIVEEVRPRVLLFSAGSTASAEEFRRTAWKLEDRDVQVIVVPALSEIAADRVRMRPVAGLPLVHMDLPRARQAMQWTKRAFDIAASALLLLILSPMLGVIALCIRVRDGKEVVFRQRRVGRDGEPFVLLKFRSMITDAEAVQVELAERAVQDRGNAVMFKMRRDPRITPTGRMLRRYSLDELPQLLNVLRGDMSLVGPRPALPRESATYDDDARRRLSVRPGITGLWQVSGRSDLAWEETVRLDLFYVDNWSFLRDLQILLRTVRAVLASSGAY